jgi:hypothetical protein
VYAREENAKWSVVDASRKVSNAPVRAFAMKIARRTQTMVNELSMLYVNFHLVMKIHVNICIVCLLVILRSGTFYV